MKLVLSTVLAVVLWVLPVTAEIYPALYTVTGVAADDVLNVRAEPTGKADLMGSLAPGQRDVEVIKLNQAGTWGMVNTGERSGWVSMRFLERNEGQETHQLPLPLTCFATEPFWTLTLAEDGEVHFEHFSEPALSLSLVEPLRSKNRPDVYGFLAQGSATLSGTVRRAMCGDGMSDRDYGFDLQLTQIGSQNQLWSGCCSLK